MDIRITGAPAGGTVRAIPSKSAAHRLMIAAFLSGIRLDPYYDGLSKDITATKECLQALGGRDEQSSRRAGEAAVLACGESGSTLRFLIPLAGVLGIDTDFHCQGRLPDRPMEPFLSVLAEKGCQVTGCNPKKLRGQLQGGEFLLPGDVSSQYVTGLLMALPLAEESSRIIVEGKVQSRPYIDLTLQVLARSGIVVSESRTAEETVFEIAGRQKYRLKEEELENLEGDWSNGAFWLAMDAMLPGRLDCTGLDPASAQGDKEIVSVIHRMQDAGTDPVELDVSNIPDLVPAIAVLACSRPAGAATHIGNAARLRMKESDRLRSVTETLQRLGADITEEEEGLLIRGVERLAGGEVSSCNDHRIVMMAAAAACIAENGILIRGAEAVDKSYPGFFEDYRRLGGRWEEVDGRR